jgi:2-polyprenyl-6-methoxyphenol hydroxylase-like FAD-dependent oxidoreductase
MASSPDIVIVGGGIAGAIAATALARGGFEVVVLERETVYPDRVRGEFIPPWGVVELKKLGLLDLLLDAGGMITTRFIPYSETLSPAEAEQRPLDLQQMHPDAPGSLCIGHPAMCELFARTATRHGARVLRGVTDIKVVAGNAPSVSFSHEGQRLDLKPQLVIGADGRNSSLRKDLGFHMHADEPHNLLGGMLISNMACWPRDMQSLGVEDRLHFLIFPQGADNLRLYACYDFADRDRFSGRDRQAKLLEAFQLKCLPFAEQLAAATPIGPFNAFSNEDTWIDQPVCPGVVLIGDAAGHNDPVIGQGVSIAARDARLVSEILIDAKKSGAAPDFTPYVEERAERMRRLRILGRLISKIRVEFGPEARARRVRVGQRSAEQQLSPFPASLIGPERLPAAAFLPETIERLLAP